MKAEHHAFLTSKAQKLSDLEMTTLPSFTASQSQLTVDGTFVIFFIYELNSSAALWLALTQIPF